jgi:hypothetical protein
VSLFGPNGSFAGGFSGAAFSGFGDYGASVEPRHSLIEQLQEAEQGAERSAVEAALTAIQQVSLLCIRILLHGNSTGTCSSIAATVCRCAENRRLVRLRELL